MFAPERWAAAFINACEAPGAVLDAAGEGLAVLKEICPQVSRIPGVVSGSTAAAQLDRMIQAAIEKARLSPETAASPGLRAARRFIILLVRKGLFHHSGAAIQEIEKILDHRKGILTVTVETPFPPDGEFQEALKRGLQKKTGALGFKLLIRIVPELLGGCRLCIGSEFLDASLRGQIQKMAADLQAAPGGIAW
ncbi:MAG: F0F1 ATP synthase subunit delta [Treponema sp.]|jgi:F-type H+-transporting ATPase subunit delta|nr:F0F1 ATP synthase subunit delta [Treponema sp.]